MDTKVFKILNYNYIFYKMLPEQQVPELVIKLKLVCLYVHLQCAESIFQTLVSKNKLFFHFQSEP